MQGLAQQTTTIVRFLHDRWPMRPTVGLILGTGLGNLAGQIESPTCIPYAEVPYLPESTAISHQGQFVCGKLQGTPVIAMQGRFHLYEGYSPVQVTLPVRAMKQLGIRRLIVSNAAGGLHPTYATGDVMAIDDHINLTWHNPLIGSNDDHWGPRFPDMSRPYDPVLIDQALCAARNAGFCCHRGVYAALAGPNYETRAEYRMLRRIGADAVGMSTVPEAIVAVHAGIPTLGLSVITNLCRPDTLVGTDGHQVQAAAETAEPKMLHIVQAIVTHDDTQRCNNT